MSDKNSYYVVMPMKIWLNYLILFFYKFDLKSLQLLTNFNLKICFISYRMKKMI
jgi:hypothetical protein